MIRAGYEIWGFNAGVYRLAWSFPSAWWSDEFEDWLRKCLARDGWTRVEIREAKHVED